jgi:hypothetical protein
MRPIFSLAALPLICACTMAPPAPPETSLPFFGNGYRGEGDQCRRLGESPETAEFLDHTADLVGCPEDMENLGVFVTDTGAMEVFRQDGYVVYSVPTGQ